MYRFNYRSNSRPFHSRAIIPPGYESNSYRPSGPDRSKWSSPRIFFSWLRGNRPGSSLIPSISRSRDRSCFCRFSWLIIRARSEGRGWGRSRGFSCSSKEKISKARSRGEGGWLSLSISFSNSRSRSCSSSQACSSLNCSLSTWSIRGRGKSSQPRLPIYRYRSGP